MAKWNRRRVLKGMLQGSAVTVALPLLDCFLDGNGEALASGAPMPPRFGTWFWPCGINAKRWYPEKLGTDFDMNVETAPLTPYQKKLTVFSGFNTILSGTPNFTHWSGLMGTLTGTCPLQGGNGIGSSEAATIDCLVADAIGNGTRFKSLELACTGNAGVSYSMRAGSTVNPSEVDPVHLYKRIFGPEFQDPNGSEFKPDPSIMLRQSVLSSVRDGRDELLRSVGAADRARLDQYFTSLRGTEQQLALMLEKPAPAEACVVPKAPAEVELGATTWESALKIHETLAQLLVMALACNQTRVFHVAMSIAVSNLRKAGQPVAFHELTHEEAIDEKLGYQPQATFFMEKNMEAFATMLRLMESIKEGNGTLLDHSLVMALSESGFAKWHTLESMPIIVAGSAGGKWRSGQHIAGKGDPTTRVGLTIQQVLGMPVGSWGTQNMATSKAIEEVVV
jgi:hypothetical protein